jgi:RNA polymerase sigma factor (sigma-70 family)
LAGGPDAAEDVFQATFLLLARKAAAVAWGPTVGPWLYHAACRLAAKARARAGRCRPHAPLGADVAAPPSDPSAGLAWAELRVALDEALAALPTRLRDPLVLCYLEGLTQDEAAAALGCSPATVKGRVTRGRERLRQSLFRRGLSLSAALAAPLVAESAITAELAVATARAAIVFQTSGAAPLAVQQLLPGTLVGWKLATGLVALVLISAAVAVGLAGTGPDAKLFFPSPAATSAAPPEPAADVLGDPLPVGAVARLGTRRLRGTTDEPRWAGFSQDGTKVASQSWNGVTVWEAATGRLLVERKDYHPRAGAVGWRADGTGVALVRLPDWSYFVSAFTDPTERLPNPPPAAGPPGNPHAAQIPGGPDVLDFLALSPDTTRVASVRDPRAERFLIDLLPATCGQPLAALKPERTLGPFPGPCREIRYTAGGQLIFLAGAVQGKGDWAIALVEPDKNVITRTTRIPRPAFCAWRYMLSLSADTRLAAIPPQSTASPRNHDGTIRVWDLVAGKELWSLPFPESGYGTGHAFTPDGSRLITSTQKSYFRVWDLATGKEVARSPGPTEVRYGKEASAVTVSSDGKRFATAARDGRVDLWDTATWKPVVPLATHRDVIGAAAVSPDSRLAATLGYDGAARVWELTTGRPVCVISAPLGREPNTRFWSTPRIAFSPDGRGLLFRASDELALADPATGKRLDLPGGMRGRRGNVGGFAADGRTLVTFADNVITLWNWPAGTARIRVTVPFALVKTPDLKERPKIVTVKSAVLSPDGRFLFTNSVRWDADPVKDADKNAAEVWDTDDYDANDVWDARTGNRLHRLTVPRTQYPRAAFAPNSRVMYLAGHSADLPARGRKVTDALTARDPATGLLVSRFADPDPGRALRRNRELGGMRTLQAVALSPDGRLLAVAEGALSPDRSVCLYETVSGGVIKKLPGHSRWVTDLAFSSDGRRLVSVSEDQTGLVWDVTPPALGAARGGKLSEAWGLLGESDARLAYTGVAALAASPTEAVRLLRTKLRPASVPTDADLDRVVGQLGADAFADREKASAELERLGPNAVAGARARLGRSPSAEVRRRLRGFLERYDGPNPSPYQLRCVRGVAALEAIGTADAQALLAELAKGPGDDLLTREARAASRRRGGR